MTLKRGRFEVFPQKEFISWYLNSIFFYVERKKKENNSSVMFSHRTLKKKITNKKKNEMMFWIWCQILLGQWRTHVYNQLLNSLKHYHQQVSGDQRLFKVLILGRIVQEMVLSKKKKRLRKIEVVNPADLELISFIIVKSL